MRVEARDGSGVGPALDGAVRCLAAGGDTEHDDGDMPTDLPMADRGEDRDGLMLDQLHVPLGPLLPDWPAGLVVHTTLQGDIIQAAQVEVLGTGGTSYWDAPRHRGDPSTAGAARLRVAAQLDSLARFLAVAGWADAAARARWLRDDALGGASAEELAPRFRRAARRLRRSRTLRWLTVGLGVVPGDAAAIRARGDVAARWSGWLAAVEQLLPDIDRTDHLPVVDPPRDPPDAVVALLPGLLTGVELATARLVVASLGPDPAVTAATVPGG